MPSYWFTEALISHEAGQYFAVNIHKGLYSSTGVRLAKSYAQSGSSRSYRHHSKNLDPVVHLLLLEASTDPGYGPFHSPKCPISTQ